MSESERRLLAILFTDIVGYTAMVGADEAQGISARQDHRRLIQTLSAQFHGEFVDESGDAALSIFPSAVDAVKCAMAIQAVLASDPAYQVRAGLHVGDVVERDGRLIGDGINVASRLPALAEPGGIVATDRVVEHLRNQRIASTPLGDKALKNVADPVPVFVVGTGGKAGTSSRRFPRWALAAVGVVAALGAWLFLGGGLTRLAIIAVDSGVFVQGPKFEQEIAFTTTDDDVRLAWASAGEGPPVVIVLGWFTHIESGSGSPGFNPWLPGLMDTHRVIHYDGRGTGLSDRNIDDFSLDAKVRDLEAVIDAAGLERFAIYAISAGGPTSISYIVRHPERVTRIAFYGSFASLGCRTGNLDRWRTLVPAMRIGWGDDNPAFRQVFTGLFMPDGNEVTWHAINEAQRTAANPDDAANFIQSLIDTDVASEARQVQIPALVTHLRGDQIVPYECGREIAALIPGARLHSMEGRNHAMFDDTEILDLSRTVETFFDADLPAQAASAP